MSSTIHLLPQTFFSGGLQFQDFVRLSRISSGSYQAARPLEMFDVSPTVIGDQTQRLFTASSVVLGRGRPSALALHRWAGDVQEV